MHIKMHKISDNRRQMLLLPIKTLNKWHKNAVDYVFYRSSKSFRMLSMSSEEFRCCWSFLFHEESYLWVLEWLTYTKQQFSNLLELQQGVKIVWKFRLGNFSFWLNFFGPVKLLSTLIVIIHYFRWFMMTLCFIGLEFWLLWFPQLFEPIML